MKVNVSFYTYGRPVCVCVCMCVYVCVCVCHFARQTTMEKAEALIFESCLLSYILVMSFVYA